MLEPLKKRGGGPGEPLGMAVVAPRMREAAGPSLVWPESAIQQPPCWCFSNARFRGEAPRKSPAAAPRKIYEL